MRIRNPRASVAIAAPVSRPPSQRTKTIWGVVSNGRPEMIPVVRPQPMSVGHTAYHHLGHTAYHHLGHDDGCGRGVPAPYISWRDENDNGFEIARVRLTPERLLIYGALTLAAAFHGYRRSGSITGTLGWVAAAYVAPVITTGVALAQGFGQRKAP